MKHLIIPDTQVKPNTPIDHLNWAGQYAVKMRPDVIVHIGDHWDMESLSSYDKGKKSFEGRRYTKDIEAGIIGMETFLKPIRDEQSRLRRNKEKQWKPRLVFTLGNHENRITRAIENDPMLDGLIGFKDFKLESMGWEVIPFLEVVVIDGIAYAHYFTSGIMGRPVSSARNMLSKKMQSCIMGHVQDRDIAFGRRADGTNLLGLFAGIFYQHDEDYLTAQTNGSWRGVWILNEVWKGGCDELPVSINYLRNKYGESK
tara:strand:+ start:1461 stop:2231 length:771 start_codon:yes stop_codon:yes gene_type:complete